MICQIHAPIKSLRAMFDILSHNVQQIWLNCSKEQFGSEGENSFFNKVELNAIGNILHKQPYRTHINFGSINTYNNEELISSTPNDNWSACIIVIENQKDIWIPSKFSQILDYFPDEYIGEFIFYKNKKIKFMAKDSVDILFDKKNIVTEFEF